MNTNEKLLKILELGIGELQCNCDQWLNSGGRGELQALENELTNLSALAARYAAYIAYRHGCGCGDQGHDRAYKAMEKADKRVRKALGFTYP